MNLVQNKPKTGSQTCGICGDTGFVDHRDGDAYACNYCELGMLKVTLYPYLRHSYAVNDITPAIHQARRIDIAEYAQTEAGKADPHLDSFRRGVMLARRKRRTDTDTPKTLQLPGSSST